MPVVVSTHPALQGPPGAQGQGIVIKGTVPNSASLPATGNPGDVWIAADTGHGWSWNQTTGTWVDIGPLQGPPGAAGTAATVTAGTATGLPAGAQPTVSNSGTSQAAIFNFGIPNGQTGAQGATGATGQTGPPGAASTVPGPAGPAGATGQTGPPGAASTVPGPAGPAGSTGPAGPKGDPGATGPVSTVPGPAGPQGNTGAAGPAGTPAWTLTVADFTVPAIGSTVVVTVNDTSWAVVGEFVWVATAGGSPTSPMALQITAKTSTSVTLLNPPTAGTAPSGDANNLLAVGSDSLLYLPPTAIQPTIWSTRLRSFNAIGNPTFEVDQRNVGNLVNNIGSGVFMCDRFYVGKSGSMTCGTRNVSGGLVAIPGSTFTISNNILSTVLSAQDVSPAAGDFLSINQMVEGVVARELYGDVTSISILCRSSVANLKFSAALTDIANNKTLCKLCSLGAANTWTLIQLPNLPALNAGINLSVGTGAYAFKIGLVSGSTYLPPANDTWQAGTFVGAVGMSNFAASPVNSTFDLAFIQHEPGSQCTTLIDKPFTANYDECLRYYQKTYDYGTAIGTSGMSAGIVSLYASSATNLQNMGHRFKKPMAKAPTVSPYNHSTGAVNSVLDWSAVSHAITAVNGPSTESPFYYLASSGLTVGQGAWVQYIADTGW